MGKRLIIKGADFSNVAASVEPILNPLNVLAVGQSGNWIDSYFQNAPVGSYFYLTNAASAGNTNLKTKDSLNHLVDAEMPEGYNSLNYCGAILIQQEGETRYDVAYPDEFEVITDWSYKKKYVYDESRLDGTAIAQEDSTAGWATSVTLNRGDVLIANVFGGEHTRALWVVDPGYTRTIKVAQVNSVATNAPICYEATENCVVLITDLRQKHYDSYILRK